MTASVINWSEFMATEPEVPRSNPGANRFSRNWVHSLFVRYAAYMVTVEASDSVANVECCCVKLGRVIVR
jgi:hypothetical protein